jgi:hypothetical protein
MPDKRVMTKQEVFAFAFDLTASALGGKPLSAPLTDKEYIRPEDFEDALDEVTRLIAESFEDMPEKVSEDFEQQELVRQKLDEVMANHVLRVRTVMDQLVRRQID